VARAEHPVCEAAGRFLSSFKRPVRLLVAISGGSDSTGLFVALATLCATGRFPGITLCACTIDHALRSGSAAEAEWVGALCARYGVAHVTRRWESGKPATGLQAAARAKRYDLLVEAAIEAGADAILAAHTRDDQAETVAMRARRAPEGVGLSGMADAVLLNGLVWLFRPFLAVERAAIRAFLGRRGETWLDDPSNDNPRFERVRVRGGALSPEPAMSDRLSLSQRAADFLAMHVRRNGGVFALEPLAIDIMLEDAAAWRGFLLLAATAGGRVHALEAASARRLATFFASGTLSRLTAGRAVFDRRRDGLFIYRENRGIEELTLPPGCAAVWDGRYRVANGTLRDIVVFAAGEGGGKGQEALHGSARRAASAMPRLRFEDGETVPADAVTAEPVIAPYLRFLPRFDLPLADALARILGCLRFPSPPNE